MKYHIVATVEKDIEAECLDEAVDIIHNTLDWDGLKPLTLYVIGKDGKAEYHREKE